MLRWLTAGESHGPSLVAILEGLPAHVQVTSGDIAEALARRRLGYGRGARMKFEQDEVTITGGIRYGETLGGPVAIEIGNTEWPKWDKVMSADPIDQAELGVPARGRPRPGSPSGGWPRPSSSRPPVPGSSPTSWSSAAWQRPSAPCRCP